MTLRVIQIGNSAGVILPQIIRSDNNIRIGDELEIHREKKGFLITKVTKTKKKKSPITVKFARIVDEFMTEHEDVLQELAKK